jgi:8-oxo-dGTP pyrophosphatase MutT (NUDIX family)
VRISVSEPTRFWYRDPNAPVPSGPPGVGVVALIEREGSLLLERRSDCGRWGLIGGALDPGESLVEAMRREVWEETGLTARVCTLFGTFSDPTRIMQYADGPPRRIVSLVYRVKIEDFAPLACSHESLELRFVPRDELAAMDIVETARPIVDAWLDGQALVLE